MKTLLGLARRTVVRRALRDGGGVWAAVAVVGYGLRLLSRMAARQDEVVHHQVLAPGETVTIAHTPTTRSDAAKQAKAAKRRKRRSRHD